MRKLMQILGFYGDDDYDESEERYGEKPQPAKKSSHAWRRDEAMNLYEGRLFVAHFDSPSSTAHSRSRARRLRRRSMGPPRARTAP